MLITLGIVLIVLAVLSFVLGIVLLAEEFLIFGVFSAIIGFLAIFAGHHSEYLKLQEACSSKVTFKEGQRATLASFNGEVTVLKCECSDAYADKRACRIATPEGVVLTVPEEVLGN